MSEKECEAILDKVRAIFTDVAATEPDAVQMTSNLRDDLDVDSLASVEIVMALEEAFGIELGGERASKLQTVGDLVQAIAAAKRGTSADAA